MIQGDFNHISYFPSAFSVAAVVAVWFVLYLIIRETVVFGSLLGGIKDGNNCSFWMKKLR